jgi:Na+/H+ antiporter NhaD/arsenite permease-like protein
LIVAELAGQQDVELGFREYLRVGVPITLMTLGMGLVWLMVVG